MHLLGAGVAHHLHDLHRGGAAHDRIVDQHDALAVDHGAVGAVLEAHAELADVLRRLDEGAPDIVVADDAELVGDAGLPAHSRSRPARRNRAPARPCRLRAGASRASSRAHGLAHVVDGAAADDRIRPREIDVFEDARPRRHRRERLVRMHAVSRRTRRPRRSPRRARICAPMMSSAQVSDARIGRPSSSPSTSGRMPSGSRAPISFLLVSATNDIGALELAQPVDEAVDEAVALAPAPPDAGSPRCRWSTA